MPFYTYYYINVFVGHFERLMNVKHRKNKDCQLFNNGTNSFFFCWVSKYVLWYHQKWSLSQEFQEFVKLSKILASLFWPSKWSDLSLATLTVVVFFTFPVAFEMTNGLQFWCRDDTIRLLSSLGWHCRAGFSFLSWGKRREMTPKGLTTRSCFHILGEERSKWNLAVIAHRAHYYWALQSWGRKTSVWAPSTSSLSLYEYL